MTARFFIVDGYNLLHAAGLSQARYSHGELQRQRHRLLVRLSSLLSDAERSRCTVVFDALEAPSGLDRQYRHAGMTVLFAEPGHDADSLIEALIDAHSAPTQLAVVSSDNRLQHAARHRRAESIDSEEFLRQLARRANPRPDPEQKQPSAIKTSPGSEDLQFWLDEFAAIDVKAIARDDDPDLLTSKDPWQKNVDDLQRQLDSENLDDWINRPPDRR
jgi:predicted RNA-binding protein with PIN domain